MKLSAVIKASEDERYERFKASFGPRITNYIMGGGRHFFCHSHCNNDPEHGSIHGCHYDDFTRWLREEGVNYTTKYNTFGARSIVLHS